MKICHLTSAHPQEDIRIFHKECISSANAGFETYQISSGNTYEKNGVHLLGIGSNRTGRLSRMIKTSKAVYLAAIKLDADLYHFHDPELLPYGLKLKKQGKKVIFDSHEDVPAQIMDKSWIPNLFRKIISGIYKKYETHVVKQLDAVVVATPHIAEKFESRANKVLVINNYPKMSDIEYHDSSLSCREAIVCYAGGICEERGEHIMIDSMKAVDGQLFLAGDHEKYKFNNVRYLGLLDRDGVNKLYGESVVGLCLLKPIENYYYSQPTKMYEYMAAGIPFVCSNFPAWRKVVKESNAGICVDPSNITEISNAINELLANRTLAERMGKNGRQFMINNYNWEEEEQKLVELYSDLCKV